MVLQPIIVSVEAEKILAYMMARGSGYAFEIAKFYDSNLRGIQKQLDKLEHGGVLYSRKVGRTRVYEFNPRYPFLTELQELLRKAITFYPEDLQEKLLIRRERPRRRGKPG
jgi:hypothetical protein